MGEALPHATWEFIPDVTRGAGARVRGWRPAGGRIGAGGFTGKTLGAQAERGREGQRGGGRRVWGPADSSGKMLRVSNRKLSRPFKGRQSVQGQDRDKLHGIRSATGAGGPGPLPAGWPPVKSSRGDAGQRCWNRTPDPVCLKMLQKPSHCPSDTQTQLLRYPQGRK